MSLRILGIVLVLVCLVGCSVGIHTSGSVVMLKESKLDQPQANVDAVEVFIGVPEKPYDVVALVHASADVMDYSYMAEYESALFIELRTQAVKAGANGIINVVREVVSGGALVTTDSYGSDWVGSYTHKDLQHHDGLAQPRKGPVMQSTHISNNYSVHFRAQAIRFKPE